MSHEKKVSLVQTLIGADEQASDALVSVYLKQAKEAILNRRFPFGYEESTEVPKMYELAQCRLAARYYLRRGSEGEQIHNEDGVHRHYGSVNDEDILMEIIQVAKVV